MDATTPQVLALFGPTAVGKTAIAIAVAERLREAGARPVAVSADALQVYRGLEILTGVASAAERARLEHRLISFVPVGAPFSAGAYARLAHAEVDGLLAEGATPIVVGGTGLYLRAALADLDLRPPPDPAIRARWSQAVEEQGVQAVHAELARRAPETAAAIAPADRHRVIRALELHEQGARHAAASPGASQLWTSATRHPTRLVALVRDREELYARIEARVDAMVAAGAAEEVRRADAAGASATARKALGFAELLAGDVEAMKTATRRYAKRQLTWLRKLPDIEVVDISRRDPADVARDILAARAPADR